MSINFSNNICSGTVTADADNWVLTVRGTCRGALAVRYLAAASPDLRESYMGSGLPWANIEMAYGHTGNKGEIKLKNGTFEFQITYPNAYYTVGGAVLVKPHIQLVFDKNPATLTDIKLGDLRIPNRSLTNLAGRPVRSVKTRGGGRTNR